MLLELSIRNLAIIDSLQLTLGEGFTVLTGETGTGKSILINALKFIMGEKLKPSLIRAGCDELAIEAVFDVPPSEDITDKLHALDIDIEGGELILSRRLFRGGRNRCRINGAAVSMQVMAEIGRRLADLHGQHQQQALLDSSAHLPYLDSYAGLEKVRGEFTGHYRQWRALLEAHQTRQREVRMAEEQKDFAAFQFRELSEAGLKPEEEEVLEEKLNVLSGLEGMNSAIEACLAALDGAPGGAMGALSRLRKELGRLCSRSAAFKGLEDSVRDAEGLLQDVLGIVQAYEMPEPVSPEELDALNARLAAIQRLKAKYRTDMEGLIALQERRRADLEMLENNDADSERRKAEIESAFAVMKKAAESLTRQRKQHAQKFESEVQARLCRLGMEEARFRCQWESIPISPFETGALSSAGADRLAFQLSANAGEPLKPLRQVASGGEISRIMLALKTVLAQHDRIPLLVFDEVDVGIGGHTAVRVGEALKALSLHHQVIVITHLHQVAAGASVHFQVSKSAGGGRTAVSVRQLKEAERVGELARMMGGGDSESSLQHARQLLDQA